MADPINNPKNIVPSKATQPIQEGEQGVSKEPTGKPFSSYMKSGETNPLIASGKTPQISPFDLAHGKVPASGPTFNTIQQQAKMAHSTLGDISSQLKTPKLKLKQSTKYLLKNKLNSAQGHIKSASQKMGAQEAAEQEVPKGSGILGKFLGLVSNGQNQLQATQDKLKDLAAKGDQMKPADMLLIQVKLSKAQQELEYSSLLLGKAVDDLKMMMNIQL